MVRKLLVVILFFCSTVCSAQVDFSCDSGTYAAFRKYKGNLIKVECDTVYLLNKFTFNMMFNSYNEFRQQNLLLSQYKLINDSISGLYESQLDSQRVYFDTLNAYFNKLAITADDLVNKSRSNLGTISNNLNDIESQIDAAKSNISNAQADITAAKKQIRKQKWKWGAGGFTIGATLTLLATFIL